MPAVFAERNRHFAAGKAERQSIRGPAAIPGETKLKIRFCR
jgi:hypothetical protein